MTPIQFLQYSRKFHHFLTPLSVLFGFSMLVSGLMLKFSDSFFVFLSGNALFQARQFHSFVSVFFSIVLLFQMVTGIAMYYTTAIAKIGKKTPAPPSPVPPSANTK
jgi:hypothetical protein